MCYPEEHGKCYLIPGTCPHTHYTVMLTPFHVAQEKLAYKVDGNEMKVLAPVDEPYQ